MVTRRPFTARTQSYARARAAANMTSTVKIWRMSKPVPDPDTLLVSTTSRALVYQGPARVHRVQGTGVMMLGEMDLDTRSVQVAIPWDAPLPRQDDVVVIDATSDSTLAAKAFQVRDVDSGGLLHDQRVLSCTGFAASSDWVDA